jgi:hypothetical protein
MSLSVTNESIIDSWALHIAKIKISDVSDNGFSPFSGKGNPLSKGGLH